MHPFALPTAFPSVPKKAASVRFAPEKRESKSPYQWENAPESFNDVCDVLLKLDDGSELPAHSQILARYSSVCADMLVDGPLSRASPAAKACLPLTDCSRATAIDLLTMLYNAAGQPTPHMTEDSSMRIAGLAHKLDMKGIVALCDDFMTGATGTYDPFTCNPTPSSFLQGKDPKAFLELMESAAQFGMSKLLASCEHCIAYDRMGKFNGILQRLPPGRAEHILVCVRRRYFQIAEQRSHDLAPVHFQS